MVGTPPWLQGKSGCSAQDVTLAGFHAHVVLDPARGLSPSTGKAIPWVDCCNTNAGRAAPCIPRARLMEARKNGWRKVFDHLDCRHFLLNMSLARLAA